MIYFIFRQQSVIPQDQGQQKLIKINQFFQNYKNVCPFLKKFLKKGIFNFLMPTQESKNNIKNNEAFMTELCTICSTTFEINQGDQPNVIEIQNQYYCEFCLEKKLLQEQQSIKNLQQRYIYYKQYQSSFNTKQYCQSSLKQALDKIQDISQIEQLQQQTFAIQELILKTKEHCRQLKDKVILVQNQQQKFWDSVNRFQKRAIKLQQKALIAKIQRGMSKAESQQLTKNSLYHEVFQITIKDSIGYISGLAMGKKIEATQVQWQQFNVGLGHLFLGINVLAMKYDYNYVKFLQVILKSNLTQVLLYGKEKKYGISYSRQNQKMFGQVMQALLTQIYHFSYHLVQTLNLQYNPQIKLPYQIKEKEYKIADIPINPNKVSQKQKWAKWSEAIKYLLINFKHLMTIHAIYGRD